MQIVAYQKKYINMQIVSKAQIFFKEKVCYSSWIWMIHFMCHKFKISFWKNQTWSGYAWMSPDDLDYTLGQLMIVQMDFNSICCELNMIGPCCILNKQNFSAARTLPILVGYR